MAGLCGSFRISMSNGRVIIPSELRAYLPDILVVCLEPAGVQCLWLMGMHTFEEWVDEYLEARLGEFDMGNSRHLALRAYLSGHAFSCALNESGAVTIPALLRGKLKMDKCVVCVGVIDHIEIWSEDAWDNACCSADIGSHAKLLG